ncbi:MAG TPA: (d)CMP kinase [Dermatophilaceae bacterium]|nr:(d)CMP kinase [Dermatophilaceae bacterium]
MSRTPLVVAIDGPSGSGKSSVARAVARQHGLAYLDTGAMYRALTWWCLDQGIDMADLGAVAAAAEEFDLRMGTDPAAPSVAVGNVVLDEAVRTTGISESVSQVAINLDVREVMRRRQRALIEAGVRERGGIVAEGRDITTVVAPDADVRILLVASEEARLRRRALEVHGETHQQAVSATHQQVVQRDRVDSTVSSFLEAAEGVTVVDTSDLDLEESVQAVLAVVGSS